MDAANDEDGGERNCFYEGECLTRRRTHTAGNNQRSQKFNGAIERGRLYNYIITPTFPQKTKLYSAASSKSKQFHSAK